MKLQRSFKVNVDTRGSGRNLVFICHDIRALTYVLGTKSVVGNQHLYKIKKVDNKWEVPINTVIERLKDLTRRRESIQESIGIMIQLVGEHNG